MPTWQATFLAMASFTGQHPAGQNLIWNGICAFVLGGLAIVCLLYTSPSPRDQRGSRMPSSA